MSYRDDMLQGFWGYVEEYYPVLKASLDSEETSSTRPPVFKEICAYRNLLSDPKLGFFKRRKLRSLIPDAGRHRWFRSMSSSQAFAQSFFGNLILLGEIDSLTELTVILDLFRLNRASAKHLLRI